MTQVAVSVAVAGGGDKELREKQAQIAQRIADATRGVVSPQNDIADFLEAIIGVLGADSTLGRLLKRIAEFFENLDPDGTKPWALQAAILMALEELANKPQAQALPDWLNAECFQSLLNNAKADVQEAGLLLANKVPQRLQEFLNCLLSQNPQAQSALAGFNLDVGKLVNCLIPAVMIYLRNKDVASAIGSFFTCMIVPGGGGGPVPGGAPFHEPVQRC